MEQMREFNDSNFRFLLQREFMLRDLHNEHDTQKELAWVADNAARFSNYFKKENQNGVLLKQFRATNDTEKPALIDTWLRKMHEEGDMKKAA